MINVVNIHVTSAVLILQSLLCPVALYASRIKNNILQESKLSLNIRRTFLSASFVFSLLFFNLDVDIVSSSCYFICVCSSPQRTCGVSLTLYRF